MQARGGAAAPARLQDAPDLAPDQRRAAASTVTTLTSRSVTTTSWVGAIGVRSGQHHEGHERRQQRERDRDRSRAAAPAARRGRRGGRHELGAWRLGRRSSSSPSRTEQDMMRIVDACCADGPPLADRLMLLYNNVAELRQFRGRKRLPMPESGRTNAWQSSRHAARRNRTLSRCVRNTWMSRSRIFLRSVLRLTPSRSAARIWLPRVAASVTDSSGCSISRRMR